MTSCDRFLWSSDVAKPSWGSMSCPPRSYQFQSDIGNVEDPVLLPQMDTYYDPIRNPFVQWRNTGIASARNPEGQAMDTPILPKQCDVRPYEPNFIGGEEIGYDNQRCSNSKKLAEIGGRIYNDPNRPVRYDQVYQFGDRQFGVMPPKYDIGFKSQYVGTDAVFIPQTEPVENNECAANTRWRKLYRNPRDMDRARFERTLQLGAQWNPYEHLDARQKMWQFQMADWAPKKGDPYTVPTARPYRGGPAPSTMRTLQEDRIIQGIPLRKF